MPAVLEGLSPWFVNKRLDPRDMRAGLAAAFAGGYDTAPGNLTREGGVLPGGGGSNGQLGVVALDQPGMGVKVIAGQCVIPVAGELGYVGTLPTSGTLDIAPADQTNPRIDLIVARVADSAEDTGDRRFTVEVVQGVASATPSEPSVSGMNCVVVAAVRVKASATSITLADITDRRLFTRAPGGIRLSYNDNNRPGGGAGDFRYDLTTRELGVWTGTEWSVAASAAGWKSWNAVLKAESDGSTVNLGTGGSVNAKYQVIGKMLTVRMLFRWGSGSYYAAPGNIYTELPPGFTNGAVHQKISCSLWVPGGPSNNRGDYTGQCLVWENSRRLSPMFPVNPSDCRQNYYRITAAAGSPGSGVPVIPSGYPEGGNVAIWGVIELP
ncbi:hypothetical protein AB0L13_40505 [Saccharopolyspora shandongensis]|uniref:hypothetical protein n=1 Tax=Saccharopolyspora shandongensis TaxID=418495 RepID=UPI00344921EF